MNNLFVVRVGDRVIYNPPPEIFDKRSESDINHWRPRVGQRATVVMCGYISDEVFLIEFDDKVRITALAIDLAVIGE